MRKRLLLVDDHRTILTPVADYFELLGWMVTTAQEFEEALALLETEAFDLMIADVRLGGIHTHEGLELLAFVRGRGFPMRVVLMTAYGSPTIRAEAERLGVDAFVAKPVSLPALAAAAGVDPRDTHAA
ncbi:MAG: response regulator [Candidatus Woesearchaeota archaeon]